MPRIESDVPRKLCVGMFAVLLAAPANAAVIETNEWETKPAQPWSANATPVIDCSVPPSPSGGCAVKFTYLAGTYTTSFGGGRVEYSIPGAPTDLYIGAWMRYSPGFQFHAVGQKVNFFILQGLAVCRNVAFGYSYGTFSSTPQICWPDGTSTTNFHANMPPAWDKAARRNEWHWYEQRMKLNTPGVHDGVAQMWVDDALILSHTNIPVRAPGDKAGWGAMQHTAEYGGGGSTLAATQYWWVDHTVISTTRIGKPGGTQMSDTKPPKAPISLDVQ